MRLAYEAYLGPFYVVSAEAELHLNDARYRVVTRARSEGIASWFFTWKSEAHSEGERTGQGLQPTRHEVDGIWRGEARRVRLAYPKAGLVRASVVPPSNGEERDPVPAGLTVDTVDPLSATLTVLLRLAEGGRCEGEFRVFDGRRRYDMAVLPGESGTLEPIHSSIFAGRAQRCDVTLRRIAGFWKKKNDFRRPVREPVLWVASPMAGVPPVPVRFTADTGFGDLRIHLTRVERNGRVISLKTVHGS
ncbi:MAG: DUF3108 domain-containing protein [Alphaproteobacteria bacterium]|nr:DUF3108 domain-containing protein [Alphaproteobacteria bacterium]